MFLLVESQRVIGQIHVKSQMVFWLNSIFSWVKCHILLKHLLPYPPANEPAHPWLRTRQDRLHNAEMTGSSVRTPYVLLGAQGAQLGGYPVNQHGYGGHGPSRFDDLLIHLLEMVIFHSLPEGNGVELHVLGSTIGVLKGI